MAKGSPPSVIVERGPDPWQPCDADVHKLKKKTTPPPAMFSVIESDGRRVNVCPFHLIDACRDGLRG